MLLHMMLIQTHTMPTLVLMPAYTFKEVSSAFTVLILLLLQCLYFYDIPTLVLVPAYTVKKSQLPLQCLYRCICFKIYPVSTVSSTW